MVDALTGGVRADGRGDEMAARLLAATPLSER